MGFMASLWAERGADLTAVDLNPVAIEQCRRRFDLFGLTGQIQPEDANRLSFDDATFDYVYSWGVLHHSPDLDRSIAELFRALRPGGAFGVMLYNRRSWLYRYQIRYVEGFLHGESRFLDPLQLASRYTDGAEHEGNPHTWPLTPEEARTLFAPHASRLDVRVLGTDLNGIFRRMVPGLSRLIPKAVMKSWARRWGWSLWISGEKAVGRSNGTMGCVGAGSSHRHPAGMK
jgi:SAM-dependent methyltransferase